MLSNDFPAYQARALVHRQVYASMEPEVSAYRELGATTTSRINGCVFCASVHARMFVNYSKKRDLVQRFLDDGIVSDAEALTSSARGCATATSRGVRSCRRSSLALIIGSR